MRPRLYYCDHYAIELPRGHAFPMAKYRLVRDRLASTGLFDFECAPPAPAEILCLAHDEGYVGRFLDGSLARSAMRRIGFPWSPALVLRTCASVGGTLAAAEDALADGFGGHLAGGTHHAFPSEGSGYCVFNDMAVAIRSLQAQGRIRKAAVLDLDVHQGDGTAMIFQHDSRVLTVSLHGARNFPFRKQKSRLDIELPDGTGDDAYLAALEGALPAVREFGPEILFYQAGVDALDSDRLGRLRLTLAGLGERDRRVFEMAAADRIPVVTVLGGGYSEPVQRTAEAHANTFLAALSVLGAKKSPCKDKPE